MANYTIAFSDILKQLYVNNKYTLKEQIEKQYTKELFLEVSDPYKIIRATRRLFFNFPYDLYDEEHKKELETKILYFFYDFEIGEETYTKFKFNFIRTFYEYLPYFNKLYKAVDNDFEFDVNVDILETIAGTDNNSGTNTTRNTASNTATDTTSNTLNSRDTDTQTTEHEERLRKSDTPQNELDNVEDEKYISEYNYNNDETNAEKTNVLNSTNNTSSTAQGSSTNLNESTNTETNTKQSTRTLKGTNTRGSKSKMLKEYIEVIQNVDMQFIEKLKSCFFLLIE